MKKVEKINRNGKNNGNNGVNWNKEEMATMGKQPKRGGKISASFWYTKSSQQLHNRKSG